MVVLKNKFNWFNYEVFVDLWWYLFWAFFNRKFCPGVRCRPQAKCPPSPPQYRQTYITQHIDACTEFTTTINNIPIFSSWLLNINTSKPEISIKWTRIENESILRMKNKVIKNKVMEDVNQNKEETAEKQTRKNNRFTSLLR